VITVEKPVVVERPKEVQVPVPVVPKEVSEKLEEYGARLEAYGSALAEVSKVLERTTALLEDNRRLREELEGMRRSHEELVAKLREGFGVVVRTKVTDPQTGKVLEEYDLHPRLKALDRQSAFVVEQVGPALVQEIRQARAELSSNVNRLISLVEGVVAPELRRRAPALVEEVQERLRRLVGVMGPAERERELSEIEARLAPQQAGPEAKPEQKGGER
jgi:hypothetical protein